MDFEEVIRKRHMTRVFKKDDVREETIYKILHNAARAPSAGHLQPWDFIVVRNKSNKEKLAKAALDQNFIAQAPVVIVTCANTQRSAAIYGERGANFYSMVDTAFTSLYILLSVTNLGLSACFVGSYDDREVSRILKLPSYVKPVGIIPIGYAGEKAQKLERLPLEKLIHYEKW